MIGEAERKEVEILKKISHTHMIQLIGTYTHHRSLGLLLSPVAVCDLHTYFEDIEAFSQGLYLDDQQQARLTTLGHFSQAQPPLQPHRGKASSIYRNIGCLISTVAYLHEQKIRHKDLKPSNILLVPGGFYLSDFGSATDFSLLSQSATDNERGTPRYYAPEVAEWKPNGRAADIFSLGCVLLEIITLHEKGTLNDLRQLRTVRDSSFHANLEKIDKWLAEWIISDMNYSPRQTHLKWEIRGMLARDPEQRPKAQELLKRIESCDDWKKSHVSMFRDCCRTASIPLHEHNRIKSKLEQDIENLYRKVESYATLQNELLATIRNVEGENNELNHKKMALELQKADLENIHYNEILTARQDKEHQIAELETRHQNEIWKTRDDLARESIRLFRSWRDSEREWVDLKMKKTDFEIERRDFESTRAEFDRRRDEQPQSPPTPQRANILRKLWHRQEPETVPDFGAPISKRPKPPRIVVKDPSGNSVDFNEF